MKHFTSVIALFCACILFASCTLKDNHAEEAQRLAQELIIVDGHIDLPYRLYHMAKSESEEEDPGDFDYERAKEGGLNAPFMSIYIPAHYQKTGGAKAFADTLIGIVKNLVEENPEKFAIATSPEEIIMQAKKGLISLPMGMENGAPIGHDLSNIQYFYDQGIRYITLTHSKDNQISDSSYDTTGTHSGLSAFGEKVVKEMNRVGMMVDVSHSSEEAFYDILEVTKAPVIASHSSCRYFVPDFERNMSDEMIKALAQNGGVMMINFGSTFISDSAAISADSMDAHISRWLEEHDLEYSDPEAHEYIAEYHKSHFDYATVEDVADHFDHVVNLVGIDHVGIGSDFDGVGDTLPVGLKDVSDYPNLIEELLDRGYTQAEIEKICYGNIFRVWNKVHEVAQTLSGAPASSSTDTTQTVSTP